MTDDLRFYPGFRQNASSKPGVVQDAVTGRVYYVKPDGSRVELGGGGGSQDLASVLAQGADAGSVGITGLADGVDLQDAPTMAQLGARTLAAQAEFSNEGGPGLTLFTNVQLVKPAVADSASEVLASPFLVAAVGVVIDNITIIAPHFSAGTLTCGVRVFVTNQDGTETIYLWLGTNSHPLTSDEVYVPTQADLSVLNQVGADLSVNGDGHVVSAAGGTFQATMTVGFAFSGLVP